MPWYRTGTISLTNGGTAVTGSGTAFIANTAAGEALLAPDGKFYEIAAVVSDTSLTLGSNYLGTTASGQAYAILPSQSFVRDLAAQAAALVQTYATIATGAGAGKFSAGTSALPGIAGSADTDTGINLAGSNVLNLVAGGATRVAVTTAGAAVTGTLSTSGNATLGDSTSADSHTVNGTVTFSVDSANSAMKITQAGAGYALLVEDQSSDSTPFVITAAGNVAVGATSGLQAKVDIVSAASGSVFVALCLANPSINSVNSGVGLFFDPNGAGALARTASIQSIQSTSGNYADLRFYVASGTTPVEMFRISATGVATHGAAFGYGLSGSGGTVTQSTGKSTGVTLNKPAGQITMHAASLAANTAVQFTLNNSNIGADDTIICHRKSGGTAGSYHVTVDSVAAGSCVISLRNMTGGALAEAVVLQFSVIKGATA